MSDEPKAKRGRPPLAPGAGSEAQIQLRVTRRRKAAYVGAAQAAGKTLAAWCFEHLDAAARAAGREPEP